MSQATTASRAAKVQAIADLDADLVVPLQDALPPADTLAVTCDHATPCELGIHASDPVPAAVAGPGIAPDQVRAFSEPAARHGGLPVGRAQHLIGWLSASRAETACR